MYKNLLPIGSVVMLKGGEKRIMICSRIQAREGESCIYDYSACYYPEGITGPSDMFFFNRDSIELIYFIGFQDKEELDFRHNILDKLGELEVKDGTIVPKG
jgi:hypothetical protein